MPAPKTFSAIDDTSKTKHVQLYGARFLRLDAIRVSKLLEIAQYALLSFWFNIIIGSFLDKLFPIYNEKKHKSLVMLEVTLQIFVLVIFLYYSRKLLSIIPFFFALTSKYISNMKGEINIGMAAAPLALVSTQFNLINKVKSLQSLFSKKASTPSAVPASGPFAVPALPSPLTWNSNSNFEKV
jgi:hypothetical protein